MRLAVKPWRQTPGRLALLPGYAMYKCGPRTGPMLALATHKYYCWRDVS